MHLAIGLFVAAAAAQTISQVLQDIQTLTTDTQKLTAQLQVVNKQTVQNIEIAALDLNTATGKAAMDAQAVQGAVSEADQVSVLQAIENLYPSVIPALAAYVPNAAKLDKLTGGAGLPAQILGNIQMNADALAAALIAKATGPYVAIGQTLQKDIDNAFNSALSGTVPTAVTLPSIPPAGGTTTTMATSSSMGTTSGPGMTTTTTAMSTTIVPPPTSTTSSPPVYGTSSTSVYETSSAPVYGTSSTPVYGTSSAPVYGTSSVPVYGTSSAPVYGTSSAPVYGTSSTPVYITSSAPVYGTSSAPVYGTSSAPVYGTSSAPASEGPTGSPSSPGAPQFQGNAGRAVAHIGAAVLAAGVAIIV